MPPSIPPLSGRFERVLPGVFTRVRISEKRVRIDAPDVMAMVTVGGVLQLLVPVIAHWSWLWAFAFSASLIFTLRIHLRVSKGRVWLVRTVLGVPWWIQRPLPSSDCIQTDWDFEGDDLVAVVAPERKDERRTQCVLSTSWHGVDWLELEEIHKACARLLDDCSLVREPRK